MSLLQDLKGKVGQTIDVAYLSSKVDANRKRAFDSEAKGLNQVTFRVQNVAAQATLQGALNACAFYSGTAPLDAASSKRASLIDLVLRYFEPVAPSAPVVVTYSTQRADNEIKKFSQAFAWKHVAPSKNAAEIKAKQRDIPVATLIPKTHALTFAQEIDALSRAGVYAAVLEWLDGQKKQLKVTGHAVEEVLYRSKSLYPIWTFTRQPDKSYASTESYSAIVYAMTETTETGKLVCNHYDVVSALQDGVLSDKVPGGYTPLPPGELGAHMQLGMKEKLVEAMKGEDENEGLRIFVKLGRR
jgi:hypothetical protein